MNWIKVATKEELPEGARKVVKVGDETVLLVCHHAEIHAVSNKCPHLRLPLQKGTLSEDGAIVCPWHKSAFDLESGDVKAWSPWPPVVGKLLGCLSREKALPVYKTKVEEGAVWVSLSS